MITVTREFADGIAEVAQLLEADEAPDDALRRLTELGAELVPGMIVGGTDARFYRGKGAIAYGAGLFSPQVSLEEGLRRTSDWIKSNLALLDTVGYVV